MAKQTPKEEPLAPPRIKKPPAPRYTPNITPLIDVLFLLLLFFVLAGKFRQDEGMIPGSLPAPNSGTVAEGPPPRVLEIHAEGEDSTKASFNFFGEGDKAWRDPAELFANLDAAYRGGGEHADEGVLVIKYYGGTRWQFVVEAYNQAARAGYKKISFNAG